MASLTVYDRSGKSVGSYDIEPTDLAVHCSVLAQIHAKTKSLAAGTKIGKVGIE